LLRQLLIERRLAISELREGEMKLITCFLIAVGVFATSQQAEAAANQGLTFPSITCFAEFRPQERCEATNVNAWLYMPEAGTDKIVVISHGTQGVDKRHYEYAEALVKVGIAALVIDHWTTRGIGKVNQDYAGNQAKGGRGPTLSIDAIMAVEHLRKLYPSLKRFGYIGESMGGSSAINLAKFWPYKLVNRRTQKNVQPFDAVVAMYPGCFDYTHDDQYNGKPFLFVLAEKDDDTPAEQCVKYSDWMNSRGGHATTIVLPGEYHDFDADYYKTYWPQAQNPRECSRMVEKSEIIWYKTNERFPNTPEGFAALLRKCTTWGVTSGYTKNRFVAVPFWTEFFAKNLAAPEAPELKVDMKVEY
jgi:dienelactone hydrolase